MANRTATLYIHYKKADGTWAYAKPAVTENSVRAENAEVPSIHEILVRSR